MDEINVTGTRAAVNEVLAATSHKVVDVFTNTEALKDVNVSLATEDVDDFMDLCEEKGVDCKLV